MILGSYEVKLLNECGMIIHDQLYTQKHIPVVKANSFKDQNKQRLVFYWRKYVQSLAKRLGPAW